MLAVEQRKEKKAMGDVLRHAGKRALSGGIPGMAAMGIQVCTLMPLRTTMNYQYVHGTSTTTALKTLYREGGVLRFYRGIAPALVQGPLSRFGDTAANAGMLALLDANDSTATLPVAVKTLAASAAAASFRIFLMPVDALKTTLQVEGKAGLNLLTNKVRASGFRVMYHGALAASAATFVGHYPWFATYNTLQEKIPKPDPNNVVAKLSRNALIGFCASVVSDTCSNSIRVIKTTRQTSSVPLSYPDTVRQIVREDGVIGLFGRGLRTRILANAMQGMMFSVLWKALEDQWKHRVEVRA